MVAGGGVGFIEGVVIVGPVLSGISREISLTVSEVSVSVVGVGEGEGEALDVGMVEGLGDGGGDGDGAAQPVVEVAPRSTKDVSVVVLLRDFTRKVYSVQAVRLDEVHVVVVIQPEFVVAV